MKKMCLVVVMAVFAFMTTNAQGDFKAGINAGLPIGDAGDLSTFAIAVDLGYFFEVSEGFTAGPVTGYTHLFAEDGETITLPGIGTITTEIDDAQFIPLAAGGRYALSEEFTVGADLGYAIAVGDGDGGFYYAPRVQYGVSETIDIVASYRGVSADGANISFIGLGVEFGL